MPPLGFLAKTHGKLWSPEAYCLKISYCMRRNSALRHAGLVELSGNRNFREHLKRTEAQDLLK